MDTRYLKTLVATVEHGSFSKAAETLHLTQSAVSQRVKFLEERFGHKLLDRSGSKLALTAAGEIVYEGAQRVLAIQDALLHDLERLDDKQGITLCCTPTFGTVFLPKVLNCFTMENSSNVDLKFLFSSPGPAVEGVRNHEFDLAIIEHCNEIDLSAFGVCHLPNDELAFVGAASLELSVPMVELEDLLERRLLTRKEGCSSRKLLETGLTKVGKQLEDFSGVLTSDDLHLTCQTVLAGGGVAYMSKDIVKDHLAAGRLTAHQVKGFPHQRCRTVIFKQEPQENELLSSFINCIFKVMQQPVPFG